MPLLTRQQLLEVNDIRHEDVPVPEWGKDVVVRVRNAQADEIDAYEYNLTKTKMNGDNVEVTDNFDNAMARLVVKCIVDENGDRVLEDKDAPALGRKSASAISRLFKRVQHLSGRTKKAQEEIEKNSAAGLTGNSPSV